MSLESWNAFRLGTDAGANRVPRQPQRRPAGIVIASVIFLLEGVALGAAAAVGYLVPHLRTDANDFIAVRAPFLREFGITRYGIFVAPVLACWNLVEGLGIWFKSASIRTYVVVDLVYRLGDAFVAIVLLLVLDRKYLMSIVDTPQWLIGVSLSFVVLRCLLDPRVSRGLSEHEQDMLRR